MMEPDNFNAKSELARLREAAYLKRKRTYRTSRLDRLAGELMQLRAAGATAADLQRWLVERRIRVTHSSVSRWLKKREHAGGQHG